jgi:hypothetical protein
MRKRNLINIPLTSKRSLMIPPQKKLGRRHEKEPEYSVHPIAKSIKPGLSIDDNTIKTKSVIQDTEIIKLEQNSEKTFPVNKLTQKEDSTPKLSTMKNNRGLETRTDEHGYPVKTTKKDISKKNQNRNDLFIGTQFLDNKNLDHMFHTKYSPRVQPEKKHTPRNRPKQGIVFEFSKHSIDRIKERIKNPRIIFRHFEENTKVKINKDRFRRGNYRIYIPNCAELIGDYDGSYFYINTVIEKLNISKSENQSGHMVKIAEVKDLKYYLNSVFKPNNKNP